MKNYLKNDINGLPLFAQNFIDIDWFWRGLFEKSPEPGNGRNVLVYYVNVECYQYFPRWGVAMSTHLLTLLMFWSLTRFWRKTKILSNGSLFL